MNPYFQHTAPLPDSIKDEIYKLYNENPTEMTPLKLGKQFNISIVRVQAILRLKALEKKMTKDVRSCPYASYIYIYELCFSNDLGKVDLWILYIINFCRANPSKFICSVRWNVCWQLERARNSQSL
jgi:hypothetical protein